MRIIVRHAFLLASLVLLSAIGYAQEDQYQPHKKLQFTVEPAIGVSFGYTRYVMNLYGYIDSAQTIVGQLKSQLDFPMDVVLTGARFKIGPAQGGKGQWSLEAEVVTSLNDPGKKMTDGDWMYIPNGFNGQFSYTESDAQLKSWILSLAFYKSILYRPKFNIDFMAGFRYDYISQEIFNYDGWQIDSNGTRVNISGVGNGIDYWVKYKMPMVGLRATIGTGAPILVNISSAFTPFFVNDYDNHLFRFKDAKASGSGTGIVSRFDGRYRLAGVNAPHTPYISVGADLTYLSANTKQTQSWYADEPGVGGGTKGEVITDIPHTISTLQAHLWLSVGLLF